MNQTTDLTHGPIAKALITLALPIVATNFLQTAYNLVDMIWIGSLGSGAVVSVGTAGFMQNMAISLFALIVSGTGIKIANYFGAKEYGKIKSLIGNAYIAACIMGLSFALAVITYRAEIIGFFNINNALIEGDAQSYLKVSMYGTLFVYFNALFSVIVNGLGNSKLPFRLNSIGFMINMFLDPILIFGVGGYLEFGVVGAAYASVIASTVVFISSIFIAKKMMGSQTADIKFDLATMKAIIKLGLPNTVQRVSFTVFGIVMARIIAGFGASGIAVQKIGLMVESISFMTAGGLYAAVMVFVGQNYGAKNIARIRQGVNVSVAIALSLGLVTTAIFLIFPRPIMSVFVDDPETIALGINYLRVIGLSQVFMCVEIVSMASFNGMGRTYVPASVSLVFTGLRIPAAIYITGAFAIGLDGVWWTISLSSIIKGVLLTTLFAVFIRVHEKKMKGKGALGK